LGKWQLEKIDTLFEESNAPLLVESKNYVGKELYFQFLKNGKFATNTDISLSKFILENQNSTIDDYEYTKGTQGDFLKLFLFDTQYQKKIEFNFIIENVDSEQPALLNR
jgi:hypothetical protein